MTQKHTKGPWELRQRGRDGKFFLDHKIGDENYSHVVFEEVKEADALLMEQAPTLLAERDRLRVCCELVAAEMHLVANGYGSAVDPLTLGKLKTLCRSWRDTLHAIAKAEKVEDPEQGRREEK